MEGGRGIVAHVVSHPSHAQVLRKIQTQDLATHLEIFDNHLENDFEEILHKFQDIEAEFNEPESVFNLLMLTCQGTGAATYFLSILQHLLLIRDDFYARCVCVCSCLSIVWGQLYRDIGFSKTA